MNWLGTVLEPVIHQGNPGLSPESDDPRRDGLVGDLLVRHGVHTPQMNTILDIQVIYLHHALAWTPRPAETKASAGDRAHARRKLWQLLVGG